MAAVHLLLEVSHSLDAVCGAEAGLGTVDTTRDVTKVTCHRCLKTTKYAAAVRLSR